MSGRLPKLPDFPPDRYSQTGDIKGANWLLLSEVRTMMRAYGQECRDAALEDAAISCEGVAAAWSTFHQVAPGAARECATTIRSMRGNK